MSRLLPLLALALAAGPAGCKKSSSAPAGTAGPAPAAADPVEAPSLAGLVALDARHEALSRQIADAFDAVKDEASARDAGPKIRGIAKEFAAVGRTRLRLIAVLDNGPTKRELDEYLDRKGAERDRTPDPALTAVRKAVQGPFAGVLRPEIDAVLDAFLEQLPTRQKQSWGERFRKEGLRG